MNRKLQAAVRVHRGWIRRHLTDTGGLLASVAYRPYQKVWLRDHALVARSLLRWEAWPEVRRAARFSARILTREAPRMARAATLPRDHPEALSEANHPRARYRPDGSWIREPWAERQYDGVALNLWFLAEVARRTGRWPVSLEVAEITARYLVRFWPEPCAGPWEMYDDARHTWTLGTIYRALQAVAPWFPWADAEAQRIHRFLETHLAPGGWPRKMLRRGRPMGWDAATLFLFLDLEVWSADSRARAFLRVLRAWLSPDGVRFRRFVVPELGVRDRYFGGGVWLITSVWAARLALRWGDPAPAQHLLERLPEGPLPEQWPGTAWDPAGRFYWQIKSRRENQGVPGPARPLAWSHAALLDLLHDLATR